MARLAATARRHDGLAAPAARGTVPGRALPPAVDSGRGGVQAWAVIDLPRVADEGALRGQGQERVPCLLNLLERAWSREEAGSALRE